MRVVFRCDPALIDILPRPIAARQALPDWLREMPNKAFSQTHGQDVRTLKQCPPFIDAMIHGFMMPLACDVLVRDGKFSWDWDLPPLSVHSHPRSPLSFHAPAQLAGTPLHNEKSAAIKFNSFWTIEIEPGYSLYATHPANRDDLPFRTLTGLVDADRFNAVGILFPAVWVDPDFSGALPAGTPIAQCFAVKRDPLELAFEPMSAEAMSRYDALAGDLLSKPGVYRRRFRASRPSSTQEGPQRGQIEP